MAELQQAEPLRGGQQAKISGSPGLSEAGDNDRTAEAHPEEFALPARRG